MLSTDAGTPEAGDGRPPVAPQARRGLRDRPLGKILLLALVLVVAAVAARTCASYNQEISKEEAIEIAKENVAFEPCAQPGCVVIRAVPRGIPSRLFWLVGLAEDLSAEGKPTRFQNLLVNATTGEVSKP